MSTCKYCGTVFVWTHDGDRFVPIEVASVTGFERRDAQRRIVFDPLNHARHDCRKDAPPPWTPPPPPAPHSWNPPWTQTPPPTDPIFTRNATKADALKVLFLAPDAPAELYKAVYRSLCQLYHPDRGGDPEKMRRLNAAFEILDRG